MSEEHNIDRMFKESLKDLDVQAPKNAWENIEKRLTKKSKRPIIPFWQKLSGVAAVIAVLILIGSQWFLKFPETNTQKSIVKTPQINNDNTTKNRQNKPSIQTNTITNLENEVEQNLLNTQPKVLNSPNSITSYIDTKQSDNTETTLKPSADLKINKTSLAKKSLSNNKVNRHKANSYINLNGADINTDSNKNNANYTIKVSKIEISDLPLDKSFMKPLPSASISAKQSLVEVAKNIKDQKQEPLKETKNSWHIKPQISPVYYGNLGSGSSLDDELSQNSSQGEVNISYGVNVAYELNDKIKLRSGINRVNLNYTTKDIFFIPDQGLSSLSNINANPNFNASVLTREQINNLSSTEVLGRASTNASELIQEIGFIEIPLEIEYKLLDKKIDVNLIGGASTLLLNENNLDLQSINGTSSVGEANNINHLSFSTNLAIGFDYDISERVILNLEPTFKYQINSFKASTTDFQPYFLGVYSGIIFKF